MWLLLAFVSATLLGLYDVVKKISLERNAVIPVLFLNIFFCCLLFLPVVLLSALAPDMMRNTLLFLPAIGSEGHFLLFLKAVIVLASWIFAYFLKKNRHKAQRNAKFYINKCRSASCMQGGLKQASA